MKLTVLGNNGPYPAAGGACSGYLLQDKEANILLDCGNGVLSNLQKFIGLESLDAIILTHLHSDHMSDIMILRYAIQTRPKRGLPAEVTDLYAPDEPASEFNQLDIKNAYNLRAITDDLVLNYGRLKLTFHLMNHPYKCYGVSADNGECRLVYTGDTAYDSELIPFFKNADVLLIDSGLEAEHATGRDVHMTAAQAGQSAAEAGVKKLILTHFVPECDPQELLVEAKKHFNNTITSSILSTYEL
ncbi:MAG: MBL fold metallo-hydrolase [Eubacteriales bacterium]|nr:MBL fold metallo-hydrolase [Eubacteriales bacterium]